MLDLEEGLESRCRLSSGGGRGCGALHREISLIVRLCVVRPRANKIALLLLTARWLIRSRVLSVLTALAGLPAREDVRIVGHTTAPTEPRLAVAWGNGLRGLGADEHREPDREERY